MVKASNNNMYIVLIAQSFGEPYKNIPHKSSYWMQLINNYLPYRLYCKCYQAWFASLADKDKQDWLPHDRNLRQLSEHLVSTNQILCCLLYSSNNLVQLRRACEQLCLEQKMITCLLYDVLKERFVLSTELGNVQYFFYSV